MNTTCSRYLIPVDFSEASKSAIRFGMEIAAHNGDELLLVHFVDHERETTKAKQKLKLLKEGLGGEMADRIAYKVFEGNVLKDIGKIALSSDSCLVIMGTHGEKGLQKIFGTNALKMISSSKVPFIVVQRETHYQEIDKIAMTIDLEKESVQVARASAILGHKLNAEVILIGGDHADPNFRRTVLLNAKIAKDYLEERGVRARVELLGRDDFEGNLIEFCRENGVDMLAATFYPHEFYFLSDKFVQRLIENKLNIPVITVDSEAIGTASPISFFTAV